jgi:uncharacterized OB-fold protein
MAALLLLPVPDPVSAPYWDACRRHELRIQRCAACGLFRFPPAPLCPHCRAPEAQWVRASGRGKVYSWIVVVHPVPREIWGDKVPYVVALVELAEGVRLPTNIVECDSARIEAGMPVEVFFDDVAPGVTLPKFRPLCLGAAG